MKSALKYITAFIVLVFISSFTPTADQHIGKWKGVDQGETGYFTFDKEGYVLMEVGGEVMRGKSFQLGETKAQMSYVIDYKSKPIKLDIIVTDLSSGEEKGRMRAIVEFISADKMKMALDFESDTRPTSFEGDDAMIFEKVK